MIGQRVLVEKIGSQIEKGKFPRFSILIGEKGSGKKELAKEIGQMLGIVCVITGTSAEQVRYVIADSYKLDLPVLYIVADCDNMSNVAANALLKITEEPPKNAYFILTCENEDNLLSTIRSRGVTFMLEPYSYEEKCDFIDTQSNRPDDDTVEFILDVSSNIGDIKSLLNMDIKAFKSYVDLVLENIAEVTDSNAFKIGDKIALKDDTDKYDLKLFWKAFCARCVDKMYEGEDTLKYARAIGITGDYSQQLNIKGINKTMLFDNWVIDVREEWL